MKLVGIVSNLSSGLVNNELAGHSDSREADACSASNRFTAKFCKFASAVFFEKWFQQYISIWSRIAVYWSTQDKGSVWEIYHFVMSHIWGVKEWTYLL